MPATSSSQDGGGSQKTLKQIQLNLPPAPFLTQQQITLTANAVYSDNSTADISQSVQWSTSNSEIARFSDHATLQLLREGTVSIIASYQGIKNQTDIKIQGQPVFLTNIADPQSSDNQNGFLLRCILNSDDTFSNCNSYSSTILLNPLSVSANPTLSKIYGIKKAEPNSPNQIYSCGLNDDLNVTSCHIVLDTSGLISNPFRIQFAPSFGYAYVLNRGTDPIAPYTTILCAFDEAHEQLLNCRVLKKQSDTNIYEIEFDPKSSQAFVALEMPDGAHPFASTNLNSDGSLNDSNWAYFNFFNSSAPFDFNFFLVSSYPSAYIMTKSFQGTRVRSLASDVKKCPISDGIFSNNCTDYGDLFPQYNEEGSLMTNHNRTQIYIPLPEGQFGICPIDATGGLNSQLCKVFALKGLNGEDLKLSLINSFSL